jgi:tryptophan synthase beta chain
VDDDKVKLYGVEAAGHGLESGQHAAALSGGKPGILHGNRTYLLQDEDGQITDAHSISAGLDYPGVGPEHSFFKETGRAAYLSATDEEALAAFESCAKLEGIIPALEPAHALARTADIARELGPSGLIIMNMCGRGDKDVFTVADALGAKI